MKLTSFLPLGLSALAVAAPTPTVEDKATLAKRASSLTDVATVGYATLNGGTTGGKGGSTTTVSSFAQFTAAVAGDSAKVVVVSGAIASTGSVKVGSNTSIIGKSSAAKLSGFTITVKDVKNVILRNFAIAKVIGGDAVTIQAASNVWVDHLDLSSDLDHDKDYYDGLIDITHACDYVTVTNTYLHDHWKASLVGHSDSNSAEDTGHLTVTYAYNYFKNLNSRGPSYRFGTGHVYNNYYDTVSDGINTRQGAQLLVQNNVFVSSKKALYSTDSGYAVASGNDFGDSENTAPTGTLTKAPYTVSNLIAASAVKAAVVGSAGVTLSF